MVFGFFYFSLFFNERDKTDIREVDFPQAFLSFAY